MNPDPGTSQTPETESDLQRALAEARRMMREQDTEYRNPGVTATYPDTEFDMEWAASIVSLPPMQDIARLAAIGAAVKEHSPLPRFGTGHVDCSCGWDAPRAGVIVWWTTHIAAIEEALR